MASLRGYAAIAAAASRSSAAATPAARSAALRSKAPLLKPSPPRRSAPLFRRSMASALGGVESLMPLHSAVAAARLRSFIATDSSCWSWLSQGLNKRI
ncbi:uncharacterized protein LOC109710432 isoform X1 [Ananas comosus]|uniref:Uncharacterized protein LOC109710432 isoform X1 n=1 Tax=Ananas comosus TaxID=4615 RepID=A0A6P5F516_ANACO|nr:uncharacterized protein LOC109710432 isoform X1 [Ananas comosus]XP_020088568.1 uncharacterized protein LOC109710432 isoform X1 [Ananas comosus]